MAKTHCTICGWIWDPSITYGREEHLEKEHGIKNPWIGAVSRLFTPIDEITTFDRNNWKEYDSQKQMVIQGNYLK